MDFPSIAQIGALGIFAFWRLRHTLAQAKELSVALQNHMKHDIEVVGDIAATLREISREVRRRE